MRALWAPPPVFIGLNWPPFINGFRLKAQIELIFRCALPVATDKKFEPENSRAISRVREKLPLWLPWCWSCYTGLWWMKEMRSHIKLLHHPFQKAHFPIVMKLDFSSWIQDNQEKNAKLFLHSGISELFSKTWLQKKVIPIGFLNRVTYDVRCCTMAGGTASTPRLAAGKSGTKFK